MDLNSSHPEGPAIQSGLQGHPNLTPTHSPVRCNFKRVFSAERPDLETTVASLNTPCTLPLPSITDQPLSPAEQSPRRVRVGREGAEQREGGEWEDLSVRFTKVETTPSATLEGKILARCGWEGSPIQCVMSLGGKAAQVRCRITAGGLQFSNGCVFRLSKITKAKIAYDEYQKCLWLTYEDTVKNKLQECKLRVHIAHDVKDDLYLLFARLLLQKLALLGRPADLKQADDPAEDRFRMEGTLLKKSQFLGKWAERRLVATDRIESFRNGKCTFAMRNIRELWSRFELHEDCLVVKVRHGSQKTQLALPAVNFAARFCSKNWLYRIYRLVSAALA